MHKEATGYINYTGNCIINYDKCLMEIFYGKRTIAAEVSKNLDTDLKIILFGPK